MYYKVIKDNIFVGVGTDTNLRRFQERNGILLFSEPDMAEYIDVNGVLYHNSLFWPVKTNTYAYVEADVYEIGEEEYNTLLPLCESGDPIPDEVLDFRQNEPESFEEPVEDLEVYKTTKINQLSRECKQAISNGFDINGVHHDLTLEDQVNLLFDIISYNTAYQSTYEDPMEFCSKAMEHIRRCREEFNRCRNDVIAAETKQAIAAVIFHVELH